MTAHSIPLTEDRHSEAIQYVTWGVEVGGKVMRIEDAQDDRSEAQNRLMWHWNREVSQQANLSADWVHGDSKLNILLPLMFAWGGKHLERAEHITEIMDCLTTYKLKVSVAYDKIRTKKLGVKHMTEYLNEYLRYYSDNGIRLTTSEDYDLAMGLR